MRHIPLGRGAVALVDDADFPWLTSMGSWRLNSSGYAVHYATHNSHRRTLYMHRLILKPDPGIQVDHINRDRLDNRRENLRFATRSQNQANKGLPINNTSQYKGVSWRKGKWEARIRYKDTRLYLGRFEQAQDAALAYDVASRQLYGDFAGCNLPEQLVTDSIREMTLARLARRLTVGANEITCVTILEASLS
ncbi:MAG: Fis family transcriptional regulator [Anaerolineaceae bacterium]|nr:Fis family transcriptional regulator [Anaerolineaceae bacterium]